MAEVKRTLVTGSAGFIGRALLRRIPGGVGYDLIAGDDVLDAARLRWVIETNEIELVYHLAAQAHVPIANHYPFTTLHTNILGTLNALDICSRLNIPVVIASSDHAYGDADRITTDTPFKARYPYDVSKACADSIAQVYLDRGAQVKIVRLCNVYGPGDTGRHRLIPYVIQSYLRGQRPTLRGDPSMIREWLYIDDAVRVYLNVPDSPETVFAVGGVRRTVGEVVDTIREILCGDEPIMAGNGKDEIKQLTFLASHQADTFEENIISTIAWWRGRV